MPSWTGYYFSIAGLSNFGDAAYTTQSSVSLVGPHVADDGAEDGTPSINGSDVVASFVMTSGITITIDGVDYTTETASYGWELANGEMLFSPDFSGSNNQAIVDALNASGGTIDSVSFNFVSANSFATPNESFSLSTERYGGPVCFAAGTRITTPDGERAVETLRTEDLVTVRNAAPQPIKWIGQSTHRFSGMGARHKPVLLPRACLGTDLPRADLVVSPQHGILLQWKNMEYLVPAQWLCGIRGIRAMRGRKSVTYVHLMLPRHGIVFSEGLASETFYPGPTAMRMVGADQRAEILGAFGTSLRGLAAGYGPRVRRIWPRTRKDQLSRLCPARGMRGVPRL